MYPISISHTIQIPKNIVVTKMTQVTYFSLVWLVSPKELSLMQSGLSQLCTVCGGKKEWHINCCDISVLEFTTYKKELEKSITKCFKYTMRMLFTLYNQLTTSTSHPHKPSRSIFHSAPNGHSPSVLYTKFSKFLLSYTLVICPTHHNLTDFTNLRTPSNLYFISFIIQF